jgi:pimeloyl-ACP methyl ester carboxylesterase
VSALRWGDGEPEFVLVHGGAQNAHTWDTVALALGARCWRSTCPATVTRTGATTAPTSPVNLADDLAVALTPLAPRASPLWWGCRSAGSPSMVLAARHPSSCARW